MNHPPFGTPPATGIAHARSTARGPLELLALLITTSLCAGCGEDLITPYTFACESDEDCVSGFVCRPSGAERTCQVDGPSCNDGDLNGDETDVDCGGSCSPCEDRLEAPALTTPADGATLETEVASLSWQPVPGASAYRLVVSDDADSLAALTGTCTDCLVDEVTTSTSFEVPVSTLTPDVTYYWMVRASRDGSEGPNSVIRSFAYSEPEPDPCELDPCGTHTTCTPSTEAPLGRECACLSGYEGDPETACTNVDECATANGNCAQTCTDSDGSYTCSCDEGYTLAADGRACDDVDECGTNNGGCAHNCSNSAGGYVCSCEPGYTLAADARACDDIDECETGNGGCAQGCTNSVGSFDCSCDAGYSLAADGKACDDVDECETNNGGCAHSCANSAGGYMCSCDDGYILAADARACDDVNECEAENGGCAQICENDIGAYACDCMEGYRLAADGHACLEWTDCRLGGASGCPSVGVCGGQATNTIPSCQANGEWLCNFSAVPFYEDDGSGEEISCDGLDNDCDGETDEGFDVFSRCEGSSGSCLNGKVMCDPTNPAATICHCAEGFSHCDNSVMDADESDIDCGGVNCGGCTYGAHCDDAGDCVSGDCVDSTCAASSCHDGVLSPGEASTDCGGLCAPCPNGRTCARAGDCSSFVCAEGHCASPTCSDGVRNGTETAEDCGGACPACSARLACVLDADCAGGHCTAGACQPAACSDGLLGPGESDVDCGGTDCVRCDRGRKCTADEDCLDQHCGAAGYCMRPVRLAVGPALTCVINASGLVRCFGGNSRGESGRGDIAPVGDDEHPRAALPVDLPGPAIQVAAGSGHACALLEDGRIFCWGATAGFGLLTEKEIGVEAPVANSPSLALGGRAISVGTIGSMTCALLYGGTVRCVSGYNQSDRDVLIGSDQGMGVPLPARATELEVGASHACALLETGSVYCWGSNANGAVGTGSATPVSTPVKPVALNAWDEVLLLRVGANGTCLGLRNQSVRCWGANSNRLFSSANVNFIGKTDYPIDYAAQTPLSALSASFSDIGVGRDHICVTFQDGELRCWGRQGAALGRGSATSSGTVNIDAALPALIGRAATGRVACGQSTQYTCVETEDGPICFGANSIGQLGLGSADMEVGSSVAEMPPQMPALWCEDSYECGDTECVRASCVATCSDGIANQGETDIDCGGPCPPCEGGAGCALGLDCSSGICASGVCAIASCVDEFRNGSESDVDCGGDDCDSCDTKARCLMDMDCSTGACIRSRCVALTCGNGSLDFGETDIDCGGECEPCELSQRCQADADCASGTCRVGYCFSAARITAGDSRTCVITAAQEVRCFGYSDQGALGYGNTAGVGTANPPYLAGSVDVDGVPISIAGGNRHTCVILDDGTARCWGANFFGALGIGTQGNQAHLGDDELPISVPALSRAKPFVQICGGAAHTCALLGGGTVECWGFGVQGQTTPPAGLSDAVELSCGYYHNCVRTQADTVRCWGNNAAGELGNMGSGSPLDFGTRIRHVAAGNQVTCAILDDSSVVCWGSGVEGMLGTGVARILGDNEVVNGFSPRASSIDRASDISVGGRTACGIRVDGTIRCWGAGLSSLGLGEVRKQPSDDESPSLLPSLPFASAALEIAAGLSHHCARFADGSVRCWGTGSGLGYPGVADENLATGQSAPVELNGP